MYYDAEDCSQIFEIKTRLWQTKLGGEQEVTEYYMEMTTLWQGLDLSVEKNGSASASVRYKKRLENKRVYEFLVGLNRDLDDVRGCILGR